MVGEYGLTGLASLVVLLILYGAPSIVAAQRQHHNRQAIYMLNLLLGWTVLGWIGALIWALTKPPDTSASHSK